MLLQENKLDHLTCSFGIIITVIVLDMQHSHSTAVFAKERIDVIVLQSLGETDLINIGIHSLGDRKKVLSLIDSLMSDVKLASKKNQVITIFVLYSYHMKLLFILVSST